MNEQLIIGLFALLGAIVTGAFSVYKVRVERRVNQVEKKAKVNNNLMNENQILEQIVPALERKDEALDKIAEILDNILCAQNLTSQQLKGMNLILQNRCQALELVQAFQNLLENYQRHDKLESLSEDDLKDISEITEKVVKTFEDNKPKE
jgi:uncharacterized protein YjiS (DUF1127 family)